MDLLPYQAHPLHRVPDDHAVGWLQWTKFSGWLYSAVRMRESSWAESLAKSSGKVKFIHWECFPQPDSYADNLEFSPSLFKFK